MKLLLLIILLFSFNSIAQVATSTPEETGTSTPPEPIPETPQERAEREARERADARRIARELHKVEMKARIAAFKEYRYTMTRTLNIRNPDAWLRDNIDSMATSTMERIVLMMEAEEIVIEGEETARNNKKDQRDTDCDDLEDSIVVPDYVIRLLGEKCK